MDLQTLNLKGTHSFGNWTSLYSQMKGYRCTHTVCLQFVGKTVA